MTACDLTRNVWRRLRGIYINTFLQQAKQWISQAKNKWKSLSFTTLFII